MVSKARSFLAGSPPTKQGPSAGSTDRRTMGFAPEGSDERRHWRQAQVDCPTRQPRRKASQPDARCSTIVRRRLRHISSETKTLRSKALGRNYKSEIQKLPSTLDWSIREPIDGLAEFVKDCSPYSLLAIGSGGSYTSASFAALLHEYCTGNIAKSLTPLDMAQTALDSRGTGVLFLTAGGRNPDIRSAFDAAIQREPRSVGVLATRSGGPLIGQAEASSNAHVFDFNIPSGKDGYLATNSLLATMILLSRAYSPTGAVMWNRAGVEEGLLSSETAIDETISSLAKKTEPLWQRPTLLVLHDHFTRPAAIDIESRFAEAALGPVLISDFRNFAHGRHYWLERRGESSGIISLVTPRTEGISKGLMRLVPDGIPKLELNMGMDGIGATVRAIVHSILLAGCAADAQGLDPGRPSVPQFGRRMYRLRSLNKLRNNNFGSLSPAAAAAIERKSRTSIARLMGDDLLPSWMNAYEDFIKSLTESIFDGVAFDYDGTLCHSSRRFKGPSSEVSKALQRLLEGELPVGIATGRGKSVREQLQACIPRKHWDKVLVAYYNGSDIAPLADEAHPNLDAPNNKDLVRVKELLELQQALYGSIDFVLRPSQLSIQSRGKADAYTLWEVVNDAVIRLAPYRLRVFRSGHSVDVVPSDVSKLRLLNSMQKYFALPTDASILSIGDRGRWPGNDSEILSIPNSLSVDETSMDTTTCWNIALPGKSGIDATLEYLSLLVITEMKAAVSRSRIEELCS